MLKGEVLMSNKVKQGIEEMMKRRVYRKMNTYFEAIQQQKLSRCQYHRAILAGDETGDMCDLDECFCVIAYGTGSCQEYDEIQMEWIAEQRDHGIKSRPKIRIVKED
jgi:hypothetical protein|tara:strand:- start:4675 stop:4995 length:321 start_codon:yes stop_codon:yes gene_type:complete